MGKKGRKTRWRRLPIGGSEEDGGISLESVGQKPAEETRITFNEDEYTKITTPRQDVLFKKGYFGRKRTPNTADVQEVHSNDSVESETYVNEEPQYMYAAAPPSYVDPTGAVYYVNSNSYETYDPYTGTVTVVVGPTPQYPPGNHPVLAAIPCQPVPLQPLEWFNPPAPWCYSYARRKRYSTDSQNCSAQSSESTGPPGSPQEPMEENAGAVFHPQQYVYPGYMFGAPMYNMNGVTVQGVIPQSPVPPADLTTTKRRKKRRRRRRGGVTDEGSESSCEEPLSCEVTGSQSGASSDAGPGSSCSKTNSDSGINTDPTPNSGTNSPPINVCQDHIDVSHLDNIYDEDNNQDNDELITSSQHSDDSHAVSEDVETVQEQIVPQESCIYPENEILSQNHKGVQEETIVPAEAPQLNECAKEKASTCETDISSEECLSSSQNISETIESLNQQNDDEVEQNSETSQEISCESEIIETEICEKDEVKNDFITTDSESFALDVVTIENINDDSVVNVPNSEVTTEEIKEEIILETEDKLEKPEEVKESEIPQIEVIIESASTESGDLSMERKEQLDSVKEELTVLDDPDRIDEVSMTLNPEQPFSRFSTCRDVTPPIPPPRRKRSMCRAADKLASKVVEQAVVEGIKEAACLRCKQSLPITEAVTRWLNSQGSSALSYVDSDDDLEEDEGIEEGEELTDQKNVHGNPFLASSLNDSRTRVADDCASFESSAGEWDMWDHTRAMCDPTQSVDKYYRLGAEEAGSGERKKPPSIIKTAVHIRHSGPFPCGICCIIQ